MTRKTAKKSVHRLDERASELPEEVAQELSPPPMRRSAVPITAQTPAQEKYISAIKAGPLVFGIGPAGTGKTYLAGALAAQALLDHTVERIIITRPVVEAGESLGFLPGELDEKYEPYLQPLRSVFYERLGKSQTGYCLKSGKIEPIPLAYMRGLTFKDTFVILDEAQNVTPVQMKMFLTRIGPNCTVVINGDPDQKDIKGRSGLDDAVERVSSIPVVRVVRFGIEDVVRSGLVQQILQAYSD